jgi:hypothetical protein
MIVPFQYEEQRRTEIIREKGLPIHPLKGHLLGFHRVAGAVHQRLHLLLHLDSDFRR